MDAVPTKEDEADEELQQDEAADCEIPAEVVVVDPLAELEATVHDLENSAGDDFDIPSDVDLEAIVHEDLSSVSPPVPPPPSSSSGAAALSSGATGSSSGAAASSSGAAAPAAPEAEEPKMTEVDTGFGKIKYYRKSGNMVAELPFHVFKKRTHLTRTTLASSVSGYEGQGRCIGFLAAWLEHVDTTKSRDFHLYSEPGYKERVDARNKFKALGGDAVSYMLRKERKPRSGEGEEPLIP